MNIRIFSKTKLRKPLQENWIRLKKAVTIQFSYRTIQTLLTLDQFLACQLPIQTKIQCSQREPTNSRLFVVTKNAVRNLENFENCEFMSLCVFKLLLQNVCLQFYFFIVLEQNGTVRFKFDLLGNCMLIVIVKCT